MKRTKLQIVTEFWASPDQARFGQAEIALVVRYSAAWLERARWAGGGPPFIHTGGTMATAKNGQQQLYGGRVHYRKCDVVAWLDAQKPIESTSKNNL